MAKSPQRRSLTGAQSLQPGCPLRAPRHLGGGQDQTQTQTQTRTRTGLCVEQLLEGNMSS
ncbi:hypothetical protein INR49_028732 [Caranx melampygus]|nr:hypothetical protein INR49_028732 [Caranx melampygus]